MILYCRTQGDVAITTDGSSGSELLAQHTLGLRQVERVDLGDAADAQRAAQAGDVDLPGAGRPCKPLPVPGFSWPPVMAVVRLSRMTVSTSLWL